jgi:hypothetical protein
VITIRLDGLKEAITRVGGAGKQARYAASRTLNRLAQEHVSPAIRREMVDSLDRPTPFTLNSVRQFGLATRDRLQTTVDFKTNNTGQRPAADYLRWQVDGGQRRLKAFELMLRSSIPALGEGYFLVPGAGAKFDEYGNVARSQIVAILSYFRAFPEEGRGYKMNSTAATRARKRKGTRTKFGYRYFVGRPGGRGPLGIWQDVRIGPGVRELLPVFLFADRARYQPRLDLETPSRLAIQRNAARLFAEEFRAAQATAR